MAMVLLFSVLLGLIILYVLITEWFYLSKMNRSLSNIPGPKPLPLIGNLLMVRCNSDILPMAKRLFQKYKGSFLVYFGPIPRLIVSDQKMAEVLLSSQTNIDKSYDYNFFHDWLGTGLLTSGGKKWRSRRKLLTPTFHFQILQKYTKMFSNQSDTLVKILKGNVDKGPFDVFPYITLCTLDIICEAAMGVTINAQKNSTSLYVRSVKKMCQIITERNSSIFKMFNCTYKFTWMYQQQRKALSIIHGFANSVIRDRKRTFIKKMSNMRSDDEFVKQRFTFLDLLLEHDLANEAIREEVDTFMFEGHDTTASGISFALYNISKHLDVQLKIVEELREIFHGDDKRPITYKDLQEMKYLEMVIKESLRLYPPVPSFSRVLNEDTLFNGILLPKGLTLTVSPFLLHRDPQVFPDPEKFDPDRFLSENAANRSPYAYVPFSAGYRNCIGQRFAMLEMKSTISKVLRHFEILPVYEHEPELLAEAIVRSNNGLFIRLKSRSF